MKNNKRIAAAIMAAAIGCTSLAGCGSTSKSSSNKNVTVKLWSHLTEAELNGIKPIAEKWAKEKGVKVQVVSDKSQRQDFIQIAKSASGPDVMYGMGHDNLGTFQKAGVLDEVPNGLVKADDYTSKAMIDAVTIGGKQYAVPIAQETCALFYNKDLVKNQPKTMEEVEQMASKDKLGFQFDIGDLYRSWGFVSAGGGYCFKDNNGTIDVKDIGLNNEGAVKGYEFFKKLVIDDKLMAADLNDNVAKANFQDKKSAFYISGPWDISVFKKAGINFGVMPMPTFDGKPMNTFMTVQAAFVSANSKNKDLAWDLIKYLNENAMDSIVTIGNRVPATKKGVESEAFKKLEFMDQFAEQAKNGQSMPNIPEMQAIWKPSRDCITALMSGKLAPKAMGDELVKQVKEGIAQQK